MGVIRRTDGTRTEIGRIVRLLGGGKLFRRLYYGPKVALRKLVVPDRDLVVKVHGFDFEITSPRRSELCADLYWSGLWEPALTSAVARLVRPTMNVLDVGAHIGYYTLLFAKLASAGAVAAFEPNPEPRAILQRNIERNALRNVGIFDFALGRKSAKGTLRDPGATSRIDYAPGMLNRNDVAVWIRRYDEIAHSLQLPAPDFVKLDVEGAELDVLTGMADHIRQSRPILLVEIHGPLLPHFGVTKGMLIEWLAARGYKPEWVSGEPLSEPGMSTAIFRPVSE